VDLYFLYGALLARAMRLCALWSSCVRNELKGLWAFPIAAPFSMPFRNIYNSLCRIRFFPVTAKEFYTLTGGLAFIVSVIKSRDFLVNIGQYTDDI
jgi:hypothetical protein